MENINLIRKVAWSFSEKSDFEYNELFGEAALAYAEAVNRFDPERDTKFSSFAYCHMRNMLINFCQKRERKEGRLDYYPEFPRSIHPVTDHSNGFWEVVENWPKDCQEIVEMILDSPEKFLAETPNFRRAYLATPYRSRKRVRRALDRKGWSNERIEEAMKQMEISIQNL